MIRHSDDARLWTLDAAGVVEVSSAMTADFYSFDMGFLGTVAARIVNEVEGVNRVVYDITSKPPGTIEWE